jgi:hypothetical protein
MSVIEFPAAKLLSMIVPKTRSMQRPFAIWKAGSTIARSSIALRMVEPAIGGREDKHEKAMFAVFEVREEAEGGLSGHVARREAARPMKRRRRSIIRQRLAAHSRRLKR